jgi:hypothetical protein
LYVGLTASYGGRSDNQVPTVVKHHLMSTISTQFVPLPVGYFCRSCLDGIDRNRARLLTAHHHELSVDARTTWRAAITAIVVGHVVSVVLAHFIALRTEPSRRSALVGLVMVLNTP